MPSSLSMDVHVPMAVTEALRRRGLDVLTSQDDGTATLDDEGLPSRAVGLGRGAVETGTGTSEDLRASPRCAP
jgi:hypothetical protein